MKWVLLDTAPDQLVAEMWRDLLRAEGVAAAVRQGDAVSFLGVSAYPCRVVVREDELDRAQQVLGEQLGREIE